ncbi:MAG: SBBP repeat-containing protein [Candidatus Pacearchaeota archaeon]|nr:SBBP repeat-containing protein [Candidatus Pacearchaeota archaeon]
MINKRLIKKWNKKIVILLVAFFLCLVLISLIIANMNIEISKAIHLDGNKNFISDIYGYIVLHLSNQTYELIGDQREKGILESEGYSGFEIMSYKVNGINFSENDYSSSQFDFNSTIIETPTQKYTGGISVNQEVYINNKLLIKQSFNVSILTQIDYDKITWNGTEYNLADYTQEKPMVFSSWNKTLPDGKVTDKIVAPNIFFDDLYNKKIDYKDVAEQGGYALIYQKDKVNYIELIIENKDINALENSKIDPTYYNQTNGFKTSSLGSDTPSAVTTNGSDFWITDISDKFIYHTNRTGGNMTDGFKTKNILGGPYGITTNNSDFWITDHTGHAVFHYNKTGGDVEDGFSTLGFMDGPTGITTNGSDFWIVDITQKKVIHVNKTGTNKGDGFSPPDIGSSSPSGITTNSTSGTPTDFWITDDVDCFVYHTNKAGTNISDGFSTFAFGSNYPSGIITNNSDFWWTDSIDDFVYHISKDIIPPNIAIVLPSNNTYSTDTGLDVNYTVSDNVAVGSCWYSNDTMARNLSLGTAGSCVNITNITWAEGKHNVTVWANDSVGNENKSTVAFTIDLTKPLVTIISPENNTITTDTGLDVNYTVSDNVAVGSCWYSNDSMLRNFSLGTAGSCVNITNITWAEGQQHNVTVWANDSAGNENYSTITFTIGLNFPVVHLISPTNNTNSASTNQTFSCNITDTTAVGSLELYIWNSTKSRINDFTTNLWNKTINGINDNADMGYGVAIDSQRNVYITGQTRWTSASTDDIYVGKWNSSGTNLWNATLNGPGDNTDSGRSIAVDPSNESNIYIVGSSVWGASYSDIYIGKWNSSGTNLWNKTINGPGNGQDYGYGVIVDSSGNVYVVGTSSWKSPNTADIYLGKWNSSGTNLWNATFNGPQNNTDNGLGVALDSQGNIYVSGDSRWTSSVSSDLYLGKWNSSGSQMWNATLDSPSFYYDSGTAVAVDPNDNNAIYVTGSNRWVVGSTTYNIYLGKWNSSGQQMWNATLNGPQNNTDSGYGVTLDSHSNIYVSGSSYWSSASNLDLYLGKWNSSGSNLWNATLNGPQNIHDYGYDVAMDSQENIYVTGSSFWSSASTADIYLGKFHQPNYPVSGTLNSTSWDYNLSSTGTYTWNCLGADSAGNQNWSAEGNYTLIIAAANTCTYTSGNWEVNCVDNCVISSNVNGGAKNLTMNGTGTFTLDANITNFIYYRILNGCNVTCRRGCINYD